MNNKFILIGITFLILIFWYFISVYTGVIEEPYISLIPVLISLVAPFISVLFVRFWIISLVRQNMQRASGKVGLHLPQELELQEVKALNRPEFVYIDKTFHIDSANTLREESVVKIYRLFRKKYFFGIIACMGYILFPFIFSKIDHVAEGEDASEYISSALSIVYFLYITLQFVFFRKQYRPQDSSKESIRDQLNADLRWFPYLSLIRIPLHFIPSLTLKIFSILKAIFSPRVEAIFLALFFYSAFSYAYFYLMQNPLFSATGISRSNFWEGIGVFTAILMHISIMIYLLKISRKYPNYTLLILRVFGSYKQTWLTFGQLSSFWQHFGTWFTIVDPSFLSQKLKLFTLKTLQRVIFIYFLIFVLMVFWSDVLKMKYESDDSNFMLREETVIILIVCFSYVIFWWQSIVHGFPKHEGNIRKRMNRVLKNPRRFDLSFKNLAIFCYDDIWRHAVKAFINQSHAVLIYLRGFSEARKGCEYEIDFLFDTFPINRIVFLVDNESNRELICEVILARWQYIRVSSPNLSIQNPEATVFVCTPEEDQDDVQTLTDLLIEACYWKDKALHAS